jgi:hypothetical protein
LTDSGLYPINNGLTALIAKTRPSTNPLPSDSYERNDRDVDQ